MGGTDPTETIRVTDRALAALRAGGLDPLRTYLRIQHVLGCGGTGYRLTFGEAGVPGGIEVRVPGGLTVSLDAYAKAHLSGASIDYDLTKETEGFWLDHPDAAFAAFC